MNKAEILRQIIDRLSHDLDVLFSAAITAHEAATHVENIPDNKYDTLALEASYVAQGQANRSHELRRSIDIYRQLKPQIKGDDTICLTSLVTLECVDGANKIIFIAPLEGGLKIEVNGREIMVITPGSPIGSALMGKQTGDIVEVAAGPNIVEYEIIQVS